MKKRIYVPAGETLCQKEINTDILVVKGTLQVEGNVIASTICGNGCIKAEEIVCDDIAMNTVIAQIVTARKVAAQKIFVKDMRAMEIVATDFFEALQVVAKKVSMTLSTIEVCEVDEIIVLKPKKRSFWRMLMTSRLKSLFLPSPKKELKPAKDNKKSEHSEPATASLTISENLVDQIVDVLVRRGYISTSMNKNAPDEEAAA